MWQTTEHYLLLLNVDLTRCAKDFGGIWLSEFLDYNIVSHLSSIIDWCCHSDLKLWVRKSSRHSLFHYLAAPDPRASSFGCLHYTIDPNSRVASSSSLDLKSPLPPPLSLSTPTC